MSLSPKRQAFVREYLIDLNATAAYKRAGYSPRGAMQSAHALLRNTEIKAAVEKGLADIAAKASITIDAVLTGLKWETQQTGEDGSPAARVRAWELLGRHLKMFSDKIDINKTVELVLIEKIVAVPHPDNAKANGTPRGPI